MEIFAFAQHQAMIDCLAGKKLTLTEFKRCVRRPKKMPGPHFEKLITDAYAAYLNAWEKRKANPVQSSNGEASASSEKRHQRIGQAQHMARPPQRVGVAAPPVRFYRIKIIDETSMHITMRDFTTLDEAIVFGRNVKASSAAGIRVVLQSLIERSSPIRRNPPHIIVKVRHPITGQSCKKFFATRKVAEAYYKKMRDEGWTADLQNLGSQKTDKLSKTIYVTRSARFLSGGLPGLGKR